MGARLRWWRGGCRRVTLRLIWAIKGTSTHSEANGFTKSIFPPPLGSAFGPLFVTFPYFSELIDFVKIELLCRRELDFESLGPFQMSLFLPWSPFQTFERFWRLISGGGPPGNLERTRGPVVCLQNAYRDRHPATTQKGNPSRMLENKTRSCWKKALRAPHQKLKT